MTAPVVGIILNCRREEGIDKRCLAESRFACNLLMRQWPEGTKFSRMGDSTIIVKAAPRFATILCLNSRVSRCPNLLGYFSHVGIIPLIRKLARSQKTFVVDNAVNRDELPHLRLRSQLETLLRKLRPC